MKKLLILLLITGFTYTHADPVPVNISGAANPDNNGLWMVDVLVGTFEDNSPELIDQIWWGNEALAYLFAATLGDAFGMVNEEDGPYFAWAATGGIQSFTAYSYTWGPSGGGHFDALSNRSDFKDVAVYAVAERPTTSVPEPATLGLLLVGLSALGFAKRKHA